MNETGTRYHEENIVELLMQYLADNNFNEHVSWDKTQTVLDNLRSIKRKVKKKLNDALAFAYDTKYGDWKAVNDLRMLYPDWHSVISKDFGDVKGENILAIGSNDGHELEAFFGKKGMTQNGFLVIDISGVAVKKGRERFGNNNHVHFEQAEVNEIKLKKHEYNISLCLRTVHSTGIDMKKCISKCYLSTKKGGTIIFSVSNGYIQEGKPIFGMYDYNTGNIDTARPQNLALEISGILKARKIKSVEIIAGPAEIFIIAKK